MANKKITELAIQSFIPANTQHLIFPVVNAEGVSPVTRKISYNLIYDSLAGISSFAYNQANTATTNAATADQRAVTSGVYANAAYGAANTANATVTSSYVHANAAFERANTNLTNTNAAISNVASNVTIVGTFANSAISLANASNTTSLVYINEGPTESKGQAGDKKGMVYIDDLNYFYYCAEDYNGTTNVWFRIATTNNW